MRGQCYESTRNGAAAALVCFGALGEYPHWRGVKSMIYDVVVQAPAINEVITTEAESEQQAKERAVYSALERQLSQATVVVKEQ